MSGMEKIFMYLFSSGDGTRTLDMLGKLLPPCPTRSSHVYLFRRCKLGRLALPL